MNKTAIMIILLFTASVQAITIPHDSYIKGDVAAEARVLCEAQKQFGSVHLNPKTNCCIDEDQNNFCGINEPLLGRCHQNICVWPTETRKMSQTAYYQWIKCDGTAISTGKEYEELLENNKCKEIKEKWYCCPKEAFKQNKKNEKITGQTTKRTAAGKHPIMVIRPNEWKLAILGRVVNPIIKKAVRIEQARCRTGGSVWNWDPSISSYFMDIRHYKKGDRVFMLKKGKIIPLISTCP